MSVKDFSYAYLTSVIYESFTTKLEMGAEYRDRLGNEWKVIELLDDNSGVGQNGSGFYGAEFEECKTATGNSTGKYRNFNTRNR